MTAEQKLRQLERKGELVSKQTVLFVNFGSSSEIGIFSGISGKEPRRRLRIKFVNQRLTTIPVNSIWGLEIFSIRGIHRLWEKVVEIAKESTNITSHERQLELVLRVKSLCFCFPDVKILDLPK